MSAFLSLTFIPMQSKAATDSTSIVMNSTQAAATAGAIQANTLTLRLNEIKEMDKSNLTFSEKRKLRREVRQIRATLEGSNGGIYISVGAIIIIVLLLIILF